MPTLYNELVRLGLKPEREFEFLAETDSLMRVRGLGVRKLVDKRFWVNKRRLHVSLIPNDNGVVETALISRAAGAKRPGFWHVVLDINGRPVAEHPLTWTSRKVTPSDPESGQPPISTGAVKSAIVETTGDMTRLLVSWLIGYDRVNDDDSAAILEILSLHADSPREVILTFETRRIAQRFHDELLCFADDVVGIEGAVDQAKSLTARVALLLKEFPV